jgi:hypothetical protein
MLRGILRMDVFGQNCEAEVGASQTMIERTQERFAIKPERLAGDTAYGSGANLNWLVKDKDIAPHIPVIDKSKREDGTFSREDFTFDKDRNVYICSANKILTTTGKLVNDGETLLYRTKVRDCRGCCSRHNNYRSSVGLNCAFGRAQCFADRLVGLAANDKFEDLPLARRHRGVSKNRHWQYRRRMTVLYSLFALRKDSGRPGPRHILSARNECILKKGED